MVQLRYELAAHWYKSGVMTDDEWKRFNSFNWPGMSLRSGNVGDDGEPLVGLGSAAYYAASFTHYPWAQETVYADEKCRTNNNFSYLDRNPKVEHDYRPRNLASTVHWHSGAWLDEWYGSWRDGYRTSTMTEWSQLDGYYAVVSCDDGGVKVEHDYRPLQSLLRGPIPTVTKPPYREDCMFVLAPYGMRYRGSVLTEVHPPWTQPAYWIVGGYLEVERSIYCDTGGRLCACCGVTDEESEFTLYHFSGYHMCVACHARDMKYAREDRWGVE